MSRRSRSIRLDRERIPPVMESDLFRPPDNALRVGLPELYVRFGRGTKYGVRYISIWRRNEHSGVLRILRKIYRKMKNA